MAASPLMRSVPEPSGVALLNPAADGGRAAALRRPVEAWLARNAPGVALLTPQSVDQAQAMLLILAPRTRVALLGGDGSLHQLLPALMRCGHRVGLVPVGTGNDVARALGVRNLPWEEALDLALHAGTRPVDIGQVETSGPAGNDARCFVSSLTVGFDARVAHRALEAPRWLRGRNRYLWATARAWARLAPVDMRIWADNRLVQEGPTLLASALNTPTYGSGIPAAPEARIDDHWLDLLVGGDIGRWRALPLMMSMLRGRHTRAPRVALYSARKLLIEAAEPLEVAADGEPLPPATRVTVHLLPKALHMVFAEPQ